MRERLGGLNPPTELLNAAKVKTEIEIEAPSTVAANFALVGGKSHVFLANFSGLIPNKVAVPAAAEKIRVKTKTAKGDVLTFVPFLGEAQLVHGERNGDDMEFVLPPVERGAVIWIGTNN